MKIALGQFAATPRWEENLATAIDLARRASAEGARLLLLPEDILAADMQDPDLTLRAAQQLDGPYVTGLIAGLQGLDLTVSGCIFVPDGSGRVYNVHIVVSAQGLIGTYRKLHLYDAFAMRESDRQTPGAEIAPLIEIDGFKIGLMTCYDVRFPELARALALNGAELIAVPSAWVRGPGKEWHWEVMLTARALENTCYVAGIGECGPRNIGCSMVVDPLGVAVVRTGQDPDLLFCEISKERIAKTRATLPVLQNRRFADPTLR
ncbi:hydrolase [Acetobacter nitrogenifigens DSM 23921 = NBRC 105050]|uniref:Hydrolase n=1 Tax=Acetobacter nitrogenifigens DSM 23921 = NBRC 105050 TaxID=1120919 RepID=A0A511X9R0_9PROT|nr:deaminated glutathione amidase [Acetobacter nitrogenifigens]GBQ93830.1 hydrolase [Acetobacter nitrogenifigens DSM 23921 = NBRC 105050]GEN59686.1 hydrolase [Acetobacter nitrogenifigens DSM 23921 = NBRC 105050]